VGFSTGAIDVTTRVFFCGVKKSHPFFKTHSVAFPLVFGFPFQRFCSVSCPLYSYQHFQLSGVAHLYFVEGCKTFGWMMMFGKDLNGNWGTASCWACHTGGL